MLKVLEKPARKAKIQEGTRVGGTYHFLIPLLQNYVKSKSNILSLLTSTCQLTLSLLWVEFNMIALHRCRVPQGYITYHYTYTWCFCWYILDSDICQIRCDWAPSHSIATCHYLQGLIQYILCEVVLQNDIWYVMWYDEYVNVSDGVLDPPSEGWRLAT